MHNCKDCRHYSWEDVNGDSDYSFNVIDHFECAKKPNIGNLKSFPFKNTKCQSFETKH